MTRKEWIKIFGYCAYRSELNSVFDPKTSHYVTEGVYNLARKQGITWDEISTSVKEVTVGFTVRFDLSPALLKEADNLFQRFARPEEIIEEIMES